MYLRNFIFPNEDQEFKFFMDQQRTCYDTYYPFQVFKERELGKIDFEPVTILYGGNGSGKTTALNVIAEKLGAQRKSVFNKSNFFPDYVDLCESEMTGAVSEHDKIITSDDVFDYMLNIRNLNEGIDQKREELFEDYIETKYTKFQMRSMEDYEQLKKVVEARSKTQSKYVRSKLNENVREFSNGESAFQYFTEQIAENGLYILDEPENSLSPKKQMELLRFIEDSARFFGCQFIISTHSPFLLSMRGAKIYDLDEQPIRVKKWTELENVRTYYDFFLQNRDKF